MNRRQDSGRTPAFEPASREFEFRLAESPYEFDFYQVVRRIECRHRSLPRIGYSNRPKHEPIRFGQDPFVHFPASSIANYRYEESGKPASMSVYFFGLFGPNGALPLHLTEHALQRKRNHNDPTFTRFANVFQHRMISFFYRAWADSEPTASFDRQDDDRVSRCVGSLFGMGFPSLRNREELSDLSKLYFSGHLARQTKNPEGLEDIVTHIIGAPARVEEFISTWVELSDDERWRLGSSLKSGLLGRNTILGGRCRQLQQKFRLEIGPLDAEQYENLLPGSPGLPLLESLVRSYVGDELTWDLKLVAESFQTIVLGSAKKRRGRLGWTACLARRHNNDIKQSGSVIIEPGARSGNLEMNSTQ